MGEGWRPVGGIEMGGKTPYCHQKTLELEREGGERTLVTVDIETEIKTLS